MLINPPHSDIVGWVFKFLEDCWVLKVAFVFEIVVKVLHRASVTGPVVPQPVAMMMLLEGPSKIGEGTLDCMNLI
jgi:hypothetical protein